MLELNRDCLTALRSRLSWLILISMLSGFFTLLPAKSAPMSQWSAEISSQPGNAAMLISEKFCSGDECICLDCPATVTEEHVYVSPPRHYQDGPYEEIDAGPPPCQKATLIEENQTVNTSERSYDTACGIRCWYWRLREGYCGRGCDYYQFRAYDYPYGQLKGGALADCKP